MKNLHAPAVPDRSRRGATLVIVALFVVILIGMCAFAIDIGHVTLVRTQLQMAADSAALAGAAAMVEGQPKSEQEAFRFALLNSKDYKLFAEENVNLMYGQWEPTQRAFVATSIQPSALKVTIQCSSQPHFFGKIFGDRAFRTTASAVATFQPRDIMLALDYSGSMCYDSQLQSVDRLGRAAVEQNLRQIYQELGSPTFGNMQLTLQTISTGSTSTIKRLLGLTNVAYPYPGDSWDNYIRYVQRDSDLRAAGYRNRYGYLTWVNYLMAERESYAETPDLWKTSEQPVTALKNATDVLLSALGEYSPDDRVGVSLYTAADGTAILESPLTKDYASVSTVVRQRQAGHYTPYTNIYDGMRTARLELENNARRGARRMMVLMTDGQANRPSPANRAKSLVLDEARAAASAGIPVFTIALGAGADTNLMKQVADITQGQYFEIPGGQSVADYEEQLKEAFRSIAAKRAVQLVQ
jgi:hypothetical protein